MNESILAWHFSDGELRFDYAGTKVEAGLVLETEEKPIAEKNGFHASINPLDALRWYAVRPQSEFIISRVRLGGEIVEDKQRVIAQKREHLWVADAKAVLEEFVAIQRHFLETVSQSDIDLCFEIWNWIESSTSHFDSSEISKENDRKEGLFLLLYPSENLLDEKRITRTSLHPLGNQVLELTTAVILLKQALQKLRAWEMAYNDGFDVRNYLGINKVIGIAMLEIQLWAFQNPPEKYRALMPSPKDSAELFQEMLMQLAPEGYRE